MSVTPTPGPSPAFDHRTVVVGTAYLMVGNVMGQVVSLAGLLLISRVYAPADVGLWAMFLGIGFMVPLLAGLRYDLATIIVDDEHDAGRLAIVTMLLGAFCAGVVFLIALGLHLFPLGVPENWVAISYAYAPYILLNGILNAGSGWGVRRKMFRWLMLVRVGQPLVTLFLQYMCRDTNYFGNGLIFGTVIGCLLTVVAHVPVLIAPAKLGLEGLHGAAQVWQSLKAIARREKSFPLYSVPYSIVGNFANQAVVVALGAWYSLAVVGFFNMAFRTLNAPMMLIVSALGQALIPVLSSARDHISRYQDVVVSFMRLLGWIHIPALIFIVVHGPAAYRFVFGAEWAQAGYYAGFLTLALFGYVMTQWLERIFDILGRQKLHLVLSISLNTLTLLAFTVTHFVFHDPVYAITAWSLGTLFYGMVWITVVFRLCRFHFSALVRVLLELAVVACTTMLLVEWSRGLAGFIEQVVAISAIFGAYGLVLWFFLKKDFGRMFSWKKA